MASEPHRYMERPGPMRALRRAVVLGLRWLETALDLPIDAPSPHPKLRQAGALHDTLISTKRLWVTAELGLDADTPRTTGRAPVIERALKTAGR
jgi:hypothetical protein